MKKFKILPDWNGVRALTLVYPLEESLFSGISNNKGRTARESILYSFTNLIHRVIENEREGFPINIVFPTEDKEHKKIKMAKEYYFAINFPNHKFNFLYIPCQDIWIKDWGPINAIYENITYLLKAKYNPSYCTGDTSIDDKAGETLSKELINTYKDRDLSYAYKSTELPFYWEGGNISASNKWIIVTDKIFKDLRYKELSDYLHNHIEQRIIKIPVEEKYDKIGHTDSICRFIDSDTVILPSYDKTKDNLKEIEYIDKVEKEIRRETTNRVNILKLESYLSDEVNREEIYSAEGCYLNYLRIGDNIYLPQFNSPKEDKKAIDTLEYFFKHTGNPGVKVIPINQCEDLAFLGGVLNCFTHVSQYWI